MKRTYCDFCQMECTGKGRNTILEVDSGFTDSAILALIQPKPLGESPFECITHTHNDDVEGTMTYSSEFELCRECFLNFIYYVRRKARLI